MARLRDLMMYVVHLARILGGENKKINYNTVVMWEI